MLFQSLEYLILLIGSVLIVRFCRNGGIIKVAILCASLFFYAYDASWQTLLFLLTISLAFFAGLILEKNKNKYLFTGIILVLFFPLFFYKYVPFLLAELTSIDVSRFTETFVLPIGISFYTFQAVGYVIDVYRNDSKAERNYLTFACFISFFPQLVAGPIERCTNLMHQITQFRKPSESDFSVGFRHILLGLCLKLLIAETMAEFVNPVYNNLSGKGGLAVLIATFCFGIQIYCDFNGYTLIAIGSAKLMGIDLMQNFNHPYRAHSISDFWRRWHISLSTWFKDYLYIPLGGNRKGFASTMINTVIVFLVSGIWHGANWTFALWGLVNGIGMAIEKARPKSVPRSKFGLFLKSLFTYVIINLFWVLFRANTLQDAVTVFKLIALDTLPQLISLNTPANIINFLLRENGWSNSMILPMLASFLIYVWYEYGVYVHFDLSTMMHSQKKYIRWSVYFILILTTLILGKTLSQSSFVYFRF